MEFATWAMDNLLTKLGELLKEEYKLQKGAREQVQSIRSELESMNAALRKVAEVPRDQLDEQVKLWARDLREQSYDMEDVIDTFLVRMEDGREATPNPHWLKELMEKTGNWFRKIKTRHQIANAIEDINNRVQEVANRRDRYSVETIMAKPATTSTIDPRLLAMYKDAAQLVGIDEPRDALIKMLSDGDDVSTNKMKIVSIVGFGGLGKTSLAKAVYDNLKVGFNCCAFVPVGRNPDMKKVLRDILIDLNKRNTNLDVTMLDERPLINQVHELLDKQKYTMLDEKQLIEELRDFLENKRYFIIIDDIWDKKSWEIIRCALPDSNYGSRVVATTRIFEVATNVGDVYELQPLSCDYSEKLFNTRIVDCERKRPHNQSTKVHDKILKKCGGVPLAIITIASLLASKPEEDWSEVYNSIGFGHGDNVDVENTRKILSFSYYDLPSHLRTCLLYLSVFPEDYWINKYILIWKWIAEGFVHDEQGIGLFEVGERYFNELINRSMIKPDEPPDTGFIVGCHVHDMVLDVIRSLSSEKNFVTILDNEQQTFQHSNARRLALQNRIEEHNPLANVRVQHVRSFTAILCHASMISPSFRVLRVLSMEKCSFMEGYNSLKHLGNLLHLRYLGLTYTPIRELPKKIGDLKFLQTLELWGTGLEELPQTVGLLTQLVCLHADDKTSVPDWIGNLTSLQQLWIEHAADSSARFVKELGNLRELRVLRVIIDVLDENLERDLMEYLGNLHKIQTVVIGGQALRKGATWEAGPVSPRLLRHFCLRCLDFTRLPAWINSSLLPNLCFLDMRVQVVQEQDMETIGRLPQLRALYLYSRYTPVVSIIGGDGQLFHKLRFFMMNTSIRFVHGECSMAPIMPSLEALDFHVHVRFMKDANLGFDKLGLGSLPSVQKVTARINCRDACAAEVEEAEAALSHAAAVHPSCPTLQTTRLDEDEMLSSDQDQDQEATRWSRKVVDFGVNVRKEKDDVHYFNFYWLLQDPCVEKLSVCINCKDASVGEVEEAEAALRHAVDVHPNHPTLEIMMLPASYYDLPSHLRTCLLYLSVFLEDDWINKDLLIWKWIAEGFVHDEQGIGLLEVGERYFNELINISMIKPDENPLTGYVHGCRVHHMVLDLARSLSKEEDFVTILDNEQQIFSQSNAPRLAFHRIKEHNPPANMSVQHVRSFTAIWCDIGMISPNFQVLHVLAIENCGFMEGYNNLEHLGNLLHLRYLGLTCTPIRELPKEIGDLKFLQTLELSRTGIEELSSSVGLLTQLVCLRADKKTRVPDWIGNLTSLQELWIWPAVDSSARFVKELGNLRELRELITTIDVREESLERDLVESLSNLHKIQYLEILGKPFGKGATWEAGTVSPRLRFLSLPCLEFSRLPVWINSSLLPNLCFLQVNVQVVQEQDMETLGRLPQLRGLGLWSGYTRVVSIIGGDGQLFHKLRFFTTNMSIRFVHGEGSMAPIMPSLEALEFNVYVQFLKDANLGFDKLGLENLPSLQRVTAEIICHDACATEVEEAEAALRHAAAVHPNRPTLQTTRLDEDRMLSSDQDQEATRFSHKVIYWDVNVRKQKDEEHYFNFHWLLRNPRVEKVSICINCEDASVGEVEEVEAALRHVVDIHPNHPTLGITMLPASYYDLPTHLRTCLLYLSVFLKDYWIDKNLLIWKWIAEGFVHDEQGIGLLEVGEIYFNELINRSMIKPGELVDTGYVTACHVHAMVLDLVRSLSSEENFVTILDNKQQTFSQSNAPRLALQNIIEEHNPLANKGVQHVSSFTAIRCRVGMISPSFRVLRTLAIENSNFMEGYISLEHLGNLLHLRYLGLTYTPVRGLPKEIGGLKFLQTLELIGTGIEELPQSIGLLTQLVCLRADDKTRVPDWIGNLTSLQELWIEPAADRSARFVKDLGSLRELRVLVARIDVWDESLERALVESLGNLHKIQHVEILGEAFGKGVTWEAGPVSPRLLRYLALGCLKFSRLPTWINSSLLPNLCFLGMDVQVVQEQDMETLGRLPQLRDLRLVSMYTVAVSIICGDGQLFHKLRFFITDISIQFVHGKGSMAPIMPSLEALEFDVNVEFMKDANLGFDKFGLENLPSLHRVTANIYCHDACAAEVEEAEAALRHTAAVHPNRPTLQTTRLCEDEMLSSDQDQEQEHTRWSRKVVDLDVNVREEKDEEHYFNFLSLLRNPRVEKFSVRINCEDARVGEVEEAEAALRHTVDVHPNHPALEITRDGEDKMMLSDQHQQQQEELGTEYLLQPLGRAEDEEHFSDFEPDENGDGAEDEEIEEDEEADECEDSLRRNPH